MWETRGDRGPHTPSPHVPGSAESESREAAPRRRSDEPARDDEVRPGGVRRLEREYACGDRLSEYESVGVRGQLLGRGTQTLRAPRLGVRRLLAEQKGDRADHLGGGAWGVAEPAGVRGVRSRAGHAMCSESTSREGTGSRHNAEGVTAAEYRPGARERCLECRDAPSPHLGLEIWGDLGRSGEIWMHLPHLGGGAEPAHRHGGQLGRADLGVGCAGSGPGSGGGERSRPELRV